MSNRTCAGLTVKKCTLEEDRLHAEGWGASTHEGVRGVVEVEILPTCQLQPELILEIAEVLADEQASDNLPRSVSVDAWKTTRDGNLVTCKVDASHDEDPDYHLSRSSEEFARNQRPMGGW